MGLEACEDLGFLGGEFFVGEDAGVAELAEFVELFGEVGLGVRRRRGSRWWVSWCG